MVSDYFKNPSASNTVGLPTRTVGGLGSYYATPSPFSSWESAANKAEVDCNLGADGAGNPPFAIEYASGVFDLTATEQVVFLSPRATRFSKGVTLKIPAGRVVDVFAVRGGFNATGAEVDGINFDYSNATAPLTSTPVAFAASPVTYTCGSIPVVLTLTKDSGVTWTSITLNGNNLGNATAGTTSLDSAAIAKKGLYLNPGDVVVFTYSAGTPVASTVTGTNLSIGASPFNYTAAVDIWVTIPQAGNTYTSITLNGASPGGNITQSKGQLDAGMWLAAGDVLHVAWSGGTPIGWSCPSQMGLNLTAAGWRNGSETRSQFILRNISVTSPTSIGANLIGTKPSGYPTDYLFGCNDGGEDSEAYSFLAESGASFRWNTNNGHVSIHGCKISGWIVSGVHTSFFGESTGNALILYTAAGPNGVQKLDFHGQWFNGSQSIVPQIYYQNIKQVKTKFYGGHFQASSSPGNPPSFIGGTAAAIALNEYYGGIDITTGYVSNIPLVSSAPSWVGGEWTTGDGASLTIANFYTNITNNSARLIKNGVLTTPSTGGTATFTAFKNLSRTNTVTSPTKLMCGFGSTATITPKASGNIRVTFDFIIDNTTLATQGVLWQGVVGTGAAPSAGSAFQSGVANSTARQLAAVPATTTGVALSVTVIVPAAVAGTAIWADLGISAVSGGAGQSVAVTSCDISFQEED